MKYLIHITIVLSALALAGCTRQETDPSGNGSKQAVSGPGASLLLESPPAGFLDLNEAVAASTPGGPIVAKGRIGGRRDPISTGFAAFVLADESIEFCDETNDDHCPTPWDACCEDPDKIRQSLAFVQIGGPDGMPLDLNPRTVFGLKENQTVIVLGRLSPESEPGNHIILADKLFLVP